MLEARVKDALALHQQGRLDDAERVYRSVLAVQPTHFGALQLLATIELQRGQWEEALALFEQALQLNAVHAISHNNAGIALWRLGRHEEAIRRLDEAIRLDPQFKQAHCNQGRAWVALNRIPEALRSYRQALALDPGYAEAHAQAALCHLLTGDYAGGWRAYEWRLETDALRPLSRNFLKPRWRGNEDLRGKTILLHAEQGYGDTLQFCRYVSRVAQLGAKIVLEVQPALVRLLAPLPGADAVVGRGADLPFYDYHCPLMSLPLALNERLEFLDGSPYLKVPQSPGGVLLPEARGKRVGVVWSGNAGHDNDANRSIPLRQFRAALASGAQYYSLQPAVRGEDRDELARAAEIAQLGTGFADFSDTARCIEQLDLVITVDTSVAHLAGAMGKPTWVLLPFAPDWRWLLERDDSPWYGSVRLFRQRTPAEGWDSVLGEVRRSLERSLQGHWEAARPSPKHESG